MSNRILEAKTSLEALTVYRGLLKDKVIDALYHVLEDLSADDACFSQFINHYCDFYFKLVEQNPEASFRDYLIQGIIFEENSFSRQCEKVSLNSISKGIKKAAEWDLLCLGRVASICSKEIKDAALEKLAKSDSEKAIIENLPQWESTGSGVTEVPDTLSLFGSHSNWAGFIKLLADFHKENGSGIFAKYKGFTWNRNGTATFLKGVLSPDPVRFHELIGYERERALVINNTLILLKGYPANNILLYGDRGTGKSSTVKALLNEYGHLGLRMIELPKAFLYDLPNIFRTIKDRQQKFIIFIDDLTFGEGEEDYAPLKAVLEGTLESKPQNVVIYATSNRRHLIKERFSDRSGLVSDNYDDEVHAADTLHEKLSLADRFGLTVTFTAPDKKEYLEIVEGIAKNRKLDIDTATLHEEALKWEMRYNGRSPRTARQFIDWLEGQLHAGIL